MCETISSTNNESFAFSFLIRVTFGSLSYLIALTRTFSTMLNRSGENMYICLVHDLRKAFNMSPLSMILLWVCDVCVCVCVCVCEITSV